MSTLTNADLDLGFVELDSMDAPDDWSERIHGIGTGLAIIGIAAGLAVLT